MVAICHIECRGRKADGLAALKKPVNAVVKIWQTGNTIKLCVACVHNTGRHGQRCKASHPEVEKAGDGVACPYSIDIP